MDSSVGPKRVTLAQVAELAGVSAVSFLAGIADVCADRGLGVRRTTRPHRRNPTPKSL